MIKCNSGYCLKYVSDRLCSAVHTPTIKVFSFSVSAYVQLMCSVWLLRTGKIRGTTSPSGPDGASISIYSNKEIIEP